jgi:hypothetical protein
VDNRVNTIGSEKSRFEPTLSCAYSLSITGSASTVVVVLGGVQADIASVLQIKRSAPSLRIVVSP